MPDAGGIPPITLLLRAAGDGDAGARARLLDIVYAELRAMAGEQLAREHAPRTLQATALVHEAYLRLFGPAGGVHWPDRAYFFAAAGEAMRRVLVDAARARRAHKRGGGADRVELDDGIAAGEAPDRVDVMALDDALARMEQQDQRMASIVKLRYFVGLSVPDTAAALELSPRTVLREWTAAKAWLHRALGGAGGGQL
jgi:RNA polymerase sigma factor (TIGR02999 family)